MTTFSPSTEEELAAFVAESARTDRKLAIRGGGTRSVVGRPVQADATVSLAAMSGITLYEPAALTIGAKAGTPLAVIEAALAVENQHLPFEPADWRGLLGTSGESTIGGAYAAGVSGPRRIQAGALRDSAIGVRFVDGTGTIVKNGGRVMKNVTGYDLVKLMAGSWGTLGIVTKLFFKVLPKPETSATVLLRGLDDTRAVEALSAALGSPFDVTGAAHLPGEEPRTIARLEGFANAIAYRSGELAKALSGFGKAEILGSDETAALWRSVRDVEAFAGRPGAVWRISTRPSCGLSVVQTVRQAMQAEAIYDWGGGLVWLLVEEKGDCGAAAIRSAVAAQGGHATLIRAGEASRARIAPFQPEAPTVSQLSAEIARRFDPAVIFNPGLLVQDRARAAA